MGGISSFNVSEMTFRGSADTLPITGIPLSKFEGSLCISEHRMSVEVCVVSKRPHFSPLNNEPRPDKAVNMQPLRLIGDFVLRCRAK